MTTIQVRTSHATSENVGNEIADLQLISDAAALAIAAWWQSPGRVGHVLAGFASGAPVESEDLLDDISATRQEVTADSTDEAELIALTRWVHDYVDTH